VGPADGVEGGVHATRAADDTHEVLGLVVDRDGAHSGRLVLGPAGGPEDLKARPPAQLDERATHPTTGTVRQDPATRARLGHAVQHLVGDEVVQHRRRRIGRGDPFGQREQQVSGDADDFRIPAVRQQPGDGLADRQTGNESTDPVHRAGHVEPGHIPGLARAGQDADPGQDVAVGHTRRGHPDRHLAGSRGDTLRSGRLQHAPPVHDGDGDTLTAHRLTGLSVPSAIFCLLRQRRSQVELGRVMRDAGVVVRLVPLIQRPDRWTGRAWHDQVRFIAADHFHTAQALVTLGRGWWYRSPLSLR
jgi:hypothetical protein